MDALREQAKAASELSPGAGLQIAYNAIFEQSEPGLKESQVGADILLIIAGSSLVPNGLARIFWIQAKKAAPDTSPFTLRYGQRNAHGLQVEALSKINAPQKGCFGLYAQYSTKLPYVPSVELDSLSWPNGKLADDLSAIGVRLPEHLVACCTSNSANMGAFSNTNDIKRYLDNVSAKKPLFIVTVTTDGLSLRHELSAGNLLSEISDYYSRKLGITQKRELKMNYGLGL